VLKKLARGTCQGHNTANQQHKTKLGGIMTDDKTPTSAQTGTPEQAQQSPVKDAKTTKIEALKKKQAQIEEQIKALEAKDNAKKRKEETHLKILIGAAMIADVEKTTAGNAEAGAKQKAAIKEVLNRAIQLKKDRDFLTAAGWL
jgi:hypothetical protein